MISLDILVFRSIHRKVESPLDLNLIEASQLMSCVLPLVHVFLTENLGSDTMLCYAAVSISLLTPHWKYIIGTLRLVEAASIL